MSPRLLTESDLLNATDSFMWLERVRNRSGGMNLSGHSRNFIQIAHNTVLNLCDMCAYTVVYEEGCPTLTRTSDAANIPPDEDIHSDSELGGGVVPPDCVRVGSCLYLKTREEFDLTEPAPFSSDVYDLGTGVFTRCNPPTGPPQCDGSTGESLSASPAGKKILHYSADGLWLFDTESETWERAPGTPPRQSGSLDFYATAITVGDSTAFVDTPPRSLSEGLRVASFSDTRGWEALVPLDVGRYFCRGLLASLGNRSTLCVSEGEISVIDEVSNEIRHLVDVDFHLEGIQIGPELCLVQITWPSVAAPYYTHDGDSDMDSDWDGEGFYEWYLLHLDLSLLQETGGQLTADMLLGDCLE
ncbi:hypothetical protein KIPB_002921 [Kipferlia bialata]|uniref:Uncharacterized protein n=1 Tax=Kipferlia bialata TaxID=797122 RepID=A0A9K3GGC2_9EUKA|nr:hypothetical protein KIPB_002921 [Kipferlia bialata]|eukprot:g2921.t1